MENPVVFSLAVLAILGTPGPTNTLLATAGAIAGLRRSIRLIPAEAAGYTISILTLGLVLGPLVARAPLLTGGLKAAVGAYLFLLAVRLWRSQAHPARAAVVTPSRVFITTLLNPKAIVFAVGVVPFRAGNDVWPPYILGFLFLVASTSTAWIVAGATLGDAAGRRGWSGTVPRFGAVIIGGFAVLLLVSPLLTWS